MLLLVIIQTDPSSIVRGEFEAKHTPLVSARKLHEVNVHWLPLAIVVAEESIRKAKLEELGKGADAAQLHDVNVHWLESTMVVGEEGR